jgi:Acyl-CoA dehydrogenases
MHPELLDSIQRLKPLGRWLYDGSTETLWERDTRTLPRDLQRRRRAYRRFAEQFIAPLAREADRDPEGVDLGPLYREAGRRGFLSEAAPWPIGAMPWRAIPGRHIFHFALKAEEFCAACGGIGLALLFHDLGMAPLLLCGDLGVWRRWLWPICRANRRGEIRLVAYAITEPEAGSDVEESEGATSARFCTVARKVRGGYVIQGQKVFISGGSRADYVVVFAVLEREDGQPPGWIGISPPSSSSGDGKGSGPGDGSASWASGPAMPPSCSSTRCSSRRPIASGRSARAGL